MNRLFRSSVLRRLAVSARRYEGQEFLFETPSKEVAYKRNYKVGEEGQFGYNNVRTFPPEYEPWRTNYDGTGMLIVWVVGFVYGRLQDSPLSLVYVRTELLGDEWQNPERSYQEVLCYLSNLQSPDLQSARFLRGRMSLSLQHHLNNFHRLERL